MRIIFETVSSDMKIMIWKLHSVKPYDSVVTDFAVNVWLQTAKAI